MKKNRVFILLLLALIIFSLVACDSKEKKEQAKEEESPEITEGKDEVGKDAEHSKTTETKEEKESSPTTETKEDEEDGATTEDTSLSEKEDEIVFYENIKETDVSKGVLMLCNKNYKLPSDFEPQTLAPVPDGYYVMDGKEYVLESEVVDAFVRMADAAASEGLNLKVISGHRTAEFQVELYTSYGDAYGYDEADTYSARPRHSEHETGLCMDINMVDNAFKDTEEYAWLMEHGANYGFILRYPEGKEHITGYIYEPWHWRYVGEKAVEIKESGLTFDEYYHAYLE